MRTFAVTDAGQEVGTLQVSLNGLYYEFYAETERFSGLRRLLAEDAFGHTLTLGTPTPAGHKLTLKRRFSATQLLWDDFHPEGTLTAYLPPVHSTPSAKTSASADDVPPAKKPLSPHSFLPAPPELPTENPLLRALPTAGLRIRHWEGVWEAAEEWSPRLPLLLAPWFQRLTPMDYDGKLLLVLRGL